MTRGVVVAFGSPDNCRLGDLGLIAAGNGSSTSGSSSSETQLRADCANSSSATNVSLWNSFKSPTQSQMMGGIEDKRQSWRYSKLAGLRFLDFLCQPGVEADKAVKELYLFGGSQQDHSSIYYKYS